MDEADVVTGGTTANAARREPHALPGQPLDRGAQVIDPQAEMVEPRLVHLGRLRRIDRLHQIDLDAGQSEDVFIHVFLFAAEGPGRRDPEQIDPQPAQRCLAGTADRDLLDAEDLERPHKARASDSVCSPGRFALTRIAMLPDGCRLSRISW